MDEAKPEDIAGPSLVARDSGSCWVLWPHALNARQTARKSHSFNLQLAYRASQITLAKSLPTGKFISAALTDVGIASYWPCKIRLMEVLEVDIAARRISNAILSMRSWLQHCSLNPPPKGWGTSLRPVLEDCSLIHHASQLEDTVHSSELFQRGHGFKLAQMAACGSAYDAILEILGKRAAEYDLFLVSINTAHHADAKRLLADLRVWGFPQKLEAALQKLWGGGGTTMVAIRYCGLEEDARLIEEELRFDILDQMLSTLRENTSRKETAEILSEGARWEDIRAEHCTRHESAACQNPLKLPDTSSYQSSSHLPELEADSVRDFTCCGLLLPYSYDLMQHYQQVHHVDIGFQTREGEYHFPQMLDSEAGTTLIPTTDIQQEIGLQEPLQVHASLSHGIQYPSDSWQDPAQQEVVDMRANAEMKHATWDGKVTPQPNIKTSGYNLPSTSAGSETSHGVRSGTVPYRPRTSGQRTFISPMIPINWSDMSPSDSFQNREVETLTQTPDTQTAVTGSQKSLSHNEGTATTNPKNHPGRYICGLFPQNPPQTTAVEGKNSDNDLQMIGFAFNAADTTTSEIPPVRQTGEGNAVVALSSPDADSPGPETPPPPYALSPGVFRRY